MLAAETFGTSEATSHATGGHAGVEVAGVGLSGGANVEASRSMSHQVRKMYLCTSKTSARAPFPVN